MREEHTRDATDQEKADVRERFGPAWERVEEVIGRAEGVLNSRDSGTRRYFRLVEIANEFSEIVAPFVACQGKGCSHCCKMAVNVTEREALRIGKYLKREPVRVPLVNDPYAILAKLDQDVERYTGKACPMLAADGSCSIYPVRPLACILQHSLEDTPELCDLTRGRFWVRKLNTNNVTVAMTAMDLNRPLGDIRDFFP